MKVRRAGRVLRSDLQIARRLVPALWSEWADLRFDAEGWLLDADAGAALPVLRLLQGRHRLPGTTYRLDTGPSEDPVTRQPKSGAVDLALVADDGRQLTVRLVGPFWQVDLTIGDHPEAQGSLDTAAALRANKTPGCLVPLIGEATSTGHAQLEPTTLDRGGDLLTARGRAQRARVAVVAEVDPKRDEWRGHIEIQVSGRGLLGRLALLAGRRPLRRGLEKSLDDLWKDLDGQARTLHTSLASLDAEIRAGGGEREWLHRELWKGLRESPASPPA